PEHEKQPSLAQQHEKPPSLAQRICDYLHQALSQVVEALERAPQTPAWSIEVLSPRERRQLVVEWNETQRDYGQARCLHELFEEQVSCSPNATAVVFEGESLTYAELNAK